MSMKPTKALGNMGPLESSRVPASPQMRLPLVGSGTTAREHRLIRATGCASSCTKTTPGGSGRTREGKTECWSVGKKGQLFENVQAHLQVVGGSHAARLFEERAPLSWGQMTLTEGS